MSKLKREAVKGDTPEVPPFTWFHITADVNHPLCLCSVCLLPITADEDDEDDPNRVPIRLFNGPFGAVFHHACLPPGIFSAQHATEEDSEPDETPA